MKSKLMCQKIDTANLLKEKYFSHADIRVDSEVELSYGSDVERIIVIEPYRIKKIYFTISPIWKRYLAINSPNTKLIVMGFCNFQSRNYIDLLNLPKDFEAYVENALPVSADWEIPIDGADMREYLKRFFEGHGGNSLLSKLNQLRQSVNIAHTQIVNKKSTFKEIWDELLLTYAKPEWKELINRWENYYPYFKYLPFCSTMQEINEAFSVISKFFTCINPLESLFFKLNMNNSLNQIYRKLTEIDRLYIRPEIYLEKKSTNINNI